MFHNSALKGLADMIRAYAIVLIISIAVVWTAGGCQEEQASSNVKQSRLIAAESGEMKAQFQQEMKKRDEEIKNLHTQMQTETKHRDDEIKNLNSQIQKRDEGIEDFSSRIQKLYEEINSIRKQFQAEREKLNADVDNFSKQLAKCEQERKAVQDKAEQDIKNLSVEYSEGIVTPILNEMGELKTEIARLKTELSKCEGKK
jgi:chromosome segregation ATPase